MIMLIINGIDERIINRALVTTRNETSEAHLFFAVMEIVDKVRTFDES